MAIEFDCPHCKQRLAIEDSVAGKQARCQGCGNAVNVPLAGTAIPPTVLPAVPSQGVVPVSIFCAKCGQRNAPNSFKCASCAAVLSHGGAPAASTEAIPNHLAQSIIVTLCCCMPLGIAAIVYSAQVNGKLAAGDVEGARESSRMANQMATWAVGLSFCVLLLRIVLAQVK